MKDTADVSSDSKRRGIADHLFLPFLLLTALYCLWVLSLPLFPSLDGSLHLYYASVLASLLSGSHTFSSYYFIRHILPPYSLHYYFLIAAAHFFGYITADKLLVCLIFLTTAFGFRYLALQLGPSGDVFSLFAVSLLVNWPLGMGFYNYCLAIGMGFWALGMWFRAVEMRSHRLWIGFFILVVLMVLTHPVPTLLLYILVGIDVGWRLLVSLRSRGNPGRAASHLWRQFRCEVLYMLAAWSTFAYISLFIGAHRVMGDVLQTYPRRIELFRLAKLSTLAMFSGSHPTVLAYRLSLYAALFLGIALATRGFLDRWHSLSLKPPDLLLVCSIILLVVIPLLPPVINGANYFAQRLVILVWLGVLAAASGYLHMSSRTRRNLALLACIDAIAVLALANAYIRPVAARLAQIESAPLFHQRMIGLTLSLPDAPVSEDLDYVPYYWAGARYFRRTESTLLNGGWLYEPYLPLASHAGQLTEKLTPSYQDSPGDFYQLLMKSKSARRQVMPHTNVLLFTGASRPADLARIVRTLDGLEPSRHWDCSFSAWYSVCAAPFVK